MRVAFDVDGGRLHGFGHVGRCVAVAERLGADAVFAVEDADVEAYLRAYGIRTGSGEDADVVVLDHVASVSADAVHMLQADGRHVVLVDDPGEARAVADLVIDPPTGAVWPSAAGQRLAGFENALIRNEIVAQRGRRHGDDVVVTYGGSDPWGMTATTAAAFSRAGIDTVSVLGPGYVGEEPTGRVVRPAPGEWGAVLAGAGIVVSAFGHTLLEAACVGIPAIAVLFREEQRENAYAFRSHGFAELVDLLTGGGADAIAGVAGAILADGAHWRSLAAEGARLVDGKGADRVVREIVRLAETDPRRGPR